jgi:hypothetical protein
LAAELLFYYSCNFFFVVTPSPPSYPGYWRHLLFSDWGAVLAKLAPKNSKLKFVIQVCPEQWIWSIVLPSARIYGICHYLSFSVISSYWQVKWALPQWKVSHTSNTIAPKIFFAALLEGHFRNHKMNQNLKGIAMATIIVHM